MPATILPVTMRNMSYKVNVLRYGLEFCYFLTHQARKLSGIIEAVISEETSKAPLTATILAYHPAGA